MLVTLADFWDGLHFLLVEGSQSSTLPAAALKFGDVSLRVGRESVHAILTRTLKRLADEINGLTEPALRERFDMERMLQANVYPVRPWMFPEEKESTFRELMVYFERFRKVVRKAAAEGDGLVFCRYEDL